MGGLKIKKQKKYELYAFHFRSLSPETTRNIIIKFLFTISPSSNIKAAIVFS